MSVSVLELVDRRKQYREKYLFEPFAKVYSTGGHRRLEAYLMSGPDRTLVWVKARDYETRQETGLGLSREQAIKFASGIFRKFIGGESMPIDENLTSSILEMYFKRRRHRSELSFDEPFIHRKILYDVLRDGETYAAQVSRKYGVSVTRGISILLEMKNAGVLKFSHKVGRVVYFTLAVDREDIDDLLCFVRLVLKLRRKAIKDITKKYASAIPDVDIIREAHEFSSRS